MLFLFWHQFHFFLFQPKIGLCIKPGMQERGTECREPGEWEEYYISGNVLKHSGKRPQTIRKNVLKHSGKCRQTFWGISPNIPGNVLKHSKECRQTFWGMLLNIPGNVTKHSRGCQIVNKIPKQTLISDFGKKSYLRYLRDRY